MKKIKLALVALVATIIITGGSVYASFPVKNEVKTTQTTKTKKQLYNKFFLNLIHLNE